MVRLACRRPVLALLDVNNTDGRVKVQTEQTQHGLRAGYHAVLLISRRVHAARARDDVTYDCWRALRVINRVIISGVASLSWARWVFGG